MTLFYALNIRCASKQRDKRDKVSLSAPARYSGLRQIQRRRIALIYTVRFWRTTSSAWTPVQLINRGNLMLLFASQDTSGKVRLSAPYDYLNHLISLAISFARLTAFNQTASMREADAQSPMAAMFFCGST